MAGGGWSVLRARLQALNRRHIVSDVGVGLRVVVGVRVGARAGVTVKVIVRSEVLPMGRFLAGLRIVPLSDFFLCPMGLLTDVCPGHV